MCQVFFLSIVEWLNCGCVGVFAKENTIVSRVCTFRELCFLGVKTSAFFLLYKRLSDAIPHNGDTICWKYHDFDVSRKF